MSDKNDKNKETREKSSSEQVIDGHTKVPGISLMARLRGYLLAGIVVIAPISITIYLTYIFLTFIDRQVVKILPEQWYTQFHDVVNLPGVGVILALAFFIVVGWFATNFLGRLFINIAEYFVDRMPVIRSLYGTIKQIFETVMATQSQAFREAVIMEYPRKGVWSIGFVTGISKGEVQKITDKETINVFVPTTPNPTSGYLLFVPKSEVVFLEMSVEEAIKLVVSAGIITPPDPSTQTKAAKKKAVFKKSKK